MFWKNVWLLQLLNNLFKVCYKSKNADIICYELTLLVFFARSKCQKFQKWKMKIAWQKNFHDFWTTWGISMKFSRKMQLMVILKVTKNQGFILPLKDIFWKTKGVSKGLELVRSLQHWVKNILEMFAIQHTSIWPNLILIVLRIQKE